MVRILLGALLWCLGILTAALAFLSPERFDNAAVDRWAPLLVYGIPGTLLIYFGRKARSRPRPAPAPAEASPTDLPPAWRPAARFAGSPVLHKFIRGGYYTGIFGIVAGALTFNPALLGGGGVLAFFALVIGRTLERPSAPRSHPVYTEAQQKRIARRADQAHKRTKA